MEEWKDIPGYEGLYEVSSTGMVRSLNYNKTGENKVLKLKKTRYGYIECVLYKSGLPNFKRVHRLVAQAFLGIEKKIVNHKNGIRDDNRVENLEWCTHSENSLHSFRILGRISAMKGRSGKLNSNSKEVLQISLNGDILKEWESISIAGNSLGLNATAISKCCKCSYGYKTCGGFIWKYKTSIS